MNYFRKVFACILTVTGLLVISIAPALAYGNSSFTYRYSYVINGSYGFYIPGYYGGYRRIPATPKQPAPTKPAPAQPTPNNPTTPAPSKPPVTPPPTSGLTAEEAKMVNLVNQERANQGIKPLSVNMSLVTLARTKSQDMVVNNYFGHISPTYGSPFDMMKNAGISYKTAGENLAGASTTEIAHQNLMNSPGHRANILNTAFNQIGIGIASGSRYGNIFTQMFIGI